LNGSFAFDLLTGFFITFLRATLPNAPKALEEAGLCTKSHKKEMQPKVGEASANIFEGEHFCTDIQGGFSENPWHRNHLRRAKWLLFVSPMIRR
jgi:hypothetical protein